MNSLDANISNIKFLITSVLKENPKREYLTSLINLCYKTAIVYIRAKGKNERYYINYFGLTFKDISWDTIAELYKRNDRGIFIELDNYFNQMNLSQTTNEDVWFALRQLIFSSVNHQLYRLNKTYDSSLGKIIRNIKQSIHNNSVLKISKYFETVIIYPKGYEYINDHKPEILPEFFEYEFLYRLKSSFEIPYMLKVFAEILNEQTDYKKIFPLIEAAIIIRKSIIINQMNPLTDTLYDNFTISELEQYINKTLVTTESTVKKYLLKGKIDKQLAEVYFYIIRDILQNEYIEAEDTSSYFNQLKKYLPETTREIYKDKHRMLVEYLAKTAKNYLNNLLKKEFVSQ